MTTCDGGERRMWILLTEDGGKEHRTKRSLHYGVLSVQLSQNINHRIRGFVGCGLWCIRSCGEYFMYTHHLLRTHTYRYGFLLLSMPWGWLLSRCPSANRRNGTATSKHGDWGLALIYSTRSPLANILQYILVYYVHWVSPFKFQYKIGNKWFLHLVLYNLFLDFIGNLHDHRKCNSILL